MSTIKVKAVDQTLTITNAPVVASGGLLENDIEFEFCSLWTGYLKTAIFYKDKNLVYSAVVGSDNKCSIPHEVTDEPGIMYFGVYGVNDDEITRTSEIIRYNIVQGALTEGTEPSDPTADFWQQCLAKISEAITASNNVVNTADTANSNSSTALAMAKSHGSRHAANGDDPVSPTDIGALPTAGGTMSGVLSMGGQDFVKNRIIGFGENDGKHIVCFMGAGNSNNGYSIWFGGGANLPTSGADVELKKIANPTTDKSAVNLAYLKSYSKGNANQVTGTGAVVVTLADNTDYKYTDVTALTFTAGEGECHGFVTFSSSGTPAITMTGFLKMDGDITGARASDVWEFSCVDKYIIWKNWSEI